MLEMNKNSYNYKLDIIYLLKPFLYYDASILKFCKIT